MRFERTSFSMIEILVAFVVVAMAGASCLDAIRLVSGVSDRSSYYQAAVEFARTRLGELMVRHRLFLGSEKGSFEACGRKDLVIDYVLTGSAAPGGTPGLCSVGLEMKCRGRPFARLRFETMISDRLSRRK